jgi:hypothetical protein
MAVVESRGRLGLQKLRHVAARLLHKGPGELPKLVPLLRVLPAKQRLFKVGDAGFEPATSAV